MIGKLQLKTRIALVTALGIMGMAGSLLFYSAQNANQQTLQAARARARLMAETNANALSIPMWDFNMEQVRGISNNVERDMDFQYLRILDDQGNVALESGYRIGDIKRVIQVDAPITYMKATERQNIGILTLQLNTEQYSAMMRDHLIVTGIVYMLAALGICALIYSLLARALKPLEALSGAMGEYSKGNRAVPLDIRHSTPEVGALIETFGTMRETVDHYQKHLEHEVEERTRELQLAMKEVESASRAKSAFLATVGHEIRTPLNGIIGMADLLTRRDLGKKENEFARVIFSSGKTLLEMINNVLDFSKSEAGKISMEIGPVPLSPIIRDSVALMKQLANSKGLTLEADIPEDLTAIGDAQYVKQTLLNLINNAVKFTDKGRVGVSVKAQNGNAIISIQDTGIGIGEEDKERLFKAFSQIEDGTNRRYEGTGLGLALCQRFITQMGGTIGVESEAGSGSRFWFSLPLER